MKKIILSIVTFCIVSFCIAQKKQIVKSTVDPFTLVTKVLKYTDRNSFSGVSKVGNASGDSFFDFSKWSKQFPNVIVSYSAFGRSAREGGVLRNFRYKNTGNFNTKIILADWQNFDKNSGSGTFELSVLNDDFPNKFYIGIQGYGWSYYFNIELNDENFQEIINLLTISGKPRDFIKEKYDKIETEKLKKITELRDKFVQDSLFKDRIEKEKIFRRKQELEIEIENQKIKNIKNIADSILKNNLKSLFINLKVGDVFLDGIVLNILNDSTAVLISLEEKFIDYGTLKTILNNKPPQNSWSVPSGEDLDYLKKMMKDNSYFKEKFNSTILQKEKFEIYEYSYWYTNGLKQLKSYLLVPANYDFNNVSNNQIPYSFKARIRFIKRFII